MRWWQRILAPYGIGLTTGRSIALEGTEWVVRGFVMSVLFSFSARAVKQRIEPWLTGEGVSKHDQGFYERCIDEVQESLGFRFSSNAQWQLTVYLKVVVARIRLGCTISSHASHRALSPYFSDLRVRLERHFGITVSLAEMHLLQDMADCCTWQWSSKLMDQYVPDERAFGIARDIVRALADSFQSEVPPSYVKPLGILVESGLTRRACGFTIKNPNELTVTPETVTAVDDHVDVGLGGRRTSSVRPEHHGFIYTVPVDDGPHDARKAIEAENIGRGELRHRYGCSGKHRIEKPASKAGAWLISSPRTIQMERARGRTSACSTVSTLPHSGSSCWRWTSLSVVEVEHHRRARYHAFRRVHPVVEERLSGRACPVHCKPKRGPENVRQSGL